MIATSLFYCCEKVLILMNIWIIGKNSNEISLPEKEDFYSYLNMEQITDADYAHAKDFEIKSLGEYHNLYVQSEAIYYC